MLKLKKTLNMKIISFLVAVIFALYSTAYGIDTPKNTFSGLRTPLITQDNPKRLIDGLYVESFAFNISERDKINRAFPELGPPILRAIDFMQNSGLLLAIFKLKIIKGADKTSAEIIEDTLILKLGDISFITEQTKNEAFLYFLFTIARSQAESSMLSPLAHPQGKPQDGFFVTKKDGIETLAFRDEETGHVFMLAANFEKEPPVDKKWLYIYPPSGLFKAGGNVIINSTIVKEGIIQETSSRQYRLSSPLMYQIGIFGNGCEIFKFIPKGNSAGFAAEDMDIIFGMSEALNQAIKLFCSAGIFKERDDVWRFSVPKGPSDKVKAEFSEDGERKRLTVHIPLDAPLSLVEAIEVLAKAFEKTDLSYLYGHTEDKQIRKAIQEAQEHIDAEKEAVLAAIRETWEYKKTLYSEMVKTRPIDEVNNKWLEQNAPYLKDRAIVSWQLEMGFHPELSLALIEVMEKEVAEGHISIQEADILLKKISMSTMAGGLGALMPDLVRGMADNGASVVTLNIGYDKYEDDTETGKWLKEALKNLDGYRSIKGITVEYDNQTRTVYIDLCRLGNAWQVWIYGMDYLYNRGDDPSSPERVSQMKFYNAAGQAVIEKLQEIGIIEQGKKIVNLENEVYTHLSKKQGDTIIVNHTVVPGAMPRYNEALFPRLRAQHGGLIFDRAGRMRPEVLGAMRARRILGVSLDHTRILRNIVFPTSLGDVGADQKKTEEILAKIVRDDKYGSSNGTHPKHFLPPQVQDLIDRYKQKFGNETINDNTLIAYLEADSVAKDKFMEELDSVTSGMEAHLLTLLRTQGINWSETSELHTGAIIRRIVDYKELRQFIRILEDKDMQERFRKSRVRVIIGGRFGPDKLSYIRDLAEACQLQDQVAVFENYNISDAPIIMQGLDFIVMLSRKGEEASATSPMKVIGGIVAVPDGICHPDEHFLAEFNPETGKGNGFIVEYDEQGIPKAESLLQCLEKMGNVLGNEKHRRQIRYNSLVARMNTNIVMHQSRGILKIMDDAIAEQILQQGLAEHLSKGYEVDPITKTIILTGNEAISFLLQTKQFQHQTTVCNLGKNPISMKLEEDSLTLENIGAISIKPQAKLEFKEITGQVIVIVTQNPDAVNRWYNDYSSENFPQLFAEKGFNKSGVISSEEWISKGVTVIDFTGRQNQWTGAQEPEWLTDSMTEGANLVGISMVQYDANTAGNWINFNEVRPSELFHNHPNGPNGNFIEIYYIAEGMAALAFLENGEIKVNIMGPGDMMVVKNEMPHTILAVKGRYKHLALQLPSAFQYGFDFKKALDMPSVLYRIIESGRLNEILSFNTTGTCIIKEADATGRFSIESMSMPSVSLLSSL